MPSAFSCILFLINSADLLDTIYDILLITQEILLQCPAPFCQEYFVTGLYLDKQYRLWQYIVEVRNI